MSSRISQGYQPKFDIDLQFGQEAETWVKDIFDGNVGTIEVKRDARFAQTSNIYIEFECKGNPSGIQTTTADFWVFVLQNTVGMIMVRTDRLKQLTREYGAKNPHSVKQCTVGSHPTRGVAVSLAWLMSAVAK